MGSTTPKISFFNTAAERAAWVKPYMPSLETSEDALGKVFARARILGRLAIERNEKALKYITTDVVAKDMLKIVEAYGETKLKFWGIS